MINGNKKTIILQSSILFSILVLTYIVYLPGLNGGFLFDDLPNLTGLEAYTYQYDLEVAKQFIFNGFSGPTGRPISLASFITQAYSWPENAYPFKLINLYLHLICGLFLYWSTYLLLKSYKYEENQAIWIALLSTSFWLLHPFFVSTTLYVIQRMAQLSTLFCLIGIVGYLKARSLLISNPLRSYIGMTLSIGLGTILATYSKENGALLPLLILVIEFLHPKRSLKPNLVWRILFLWAPSILIFIMLLKYVEFSENPWPHRNFNQIERLLTETRVVSDYLIRLFIPKIEGLGLFQDGYIISKDWFNPLSTFFSTFFLFSLLILSFILRKKWMLVSLAILFFFTAHLMESTLIGLEIYFEHRNYLASAFLFLPIAAGIYKLKEWIKPSLVVLISILIIGLLSFLTFQRANLWSNTPQLQMYWAFNSESSPRAQSQIANFMMNEGFYKNAVEKITDVYDKLPESGLISAHYLLIKIDTQTVTAKDFDIVEHRLTIQKPDPQAVVGLRSITDSIISNPIMTKKYANRMNTLLNNVYENNLGYQNFPKFKPLHLYLQGKLFLASGQIQPAYEKYLQSLLIYQDVDTGLAIVSELIRYNQFPLAVKLLNETQNILMKTSEKNLKSSKAYYLDIINDFRVNLNQELNNANQN